MITVLHDAWRPDPLAWIHRAEAREVAGELRRAGHTVGLARCSEATLSRPPAGALILRLSDPLMLPAARALERAATPFLGPRAAVMERCYDKYGADPIRSACASCSAGRYRLARETMRTSCSSTCAAWSSP